MKLVDALVTTLRDWDVGYVFGVSGANIEHVHDAIHRLGGERLRSVLARSEGGAAFMADCRARVHRTLGICAATSGGGMMNLAVGVAEAYAESVPVLALVGQAPSALEGRGAFQDSSGIGRTVDAIGLWRAMTKLVARVDAGRSFWERLHAAVAAALSGRPGPAVLLLPRDVY
ncbi:MAG TPA: thiamine pyrophosphate-binding protein, partial [Kofleriaceae bacterium]